MVRSRWLIVRLALVGILALLVFPGASSALRASFVYLTATGPSPATLTIPAGLYPVWMNKDTVAHTVSFPSGCSIQVAPGGTAQCDNGLGRFVGDYPYAVDGSTQGHVVVEPVGRGVSLSASTHAVKLGSALTLHGRLVEEDATFSPPSAGQPQPVVVIARPYAGHPFHRVAVVMATVHPPTKRAPFGELLWQVRIRPHWNMTYLAIASFQPPGGRVWERARSKPLRVNVDRRGRRPARR